MSHPRAFSIFSFPKMRKMLREGEKYFATINHGKNETMAIVEIFLRHGMHIKGPSNPLQNYQSLSNSRPKKPREIPKIAPLTFTHTQNEAFHHLRCFRFALGRRPGPSPIWSHLFQVHSILQKCSGLNLNMSKERVDKTHNSRELLKTQDK